MPKEQVLPPVLSRVIELAETLLTGVPAKEVAALRALQTLSNEEVRQLNRELRLPAPRRRQKHLLRVNLVPQVAHFLSEPESREPIIIDLRDRAGNIIDEERLNHALSDHTAPTPG